MDEELENVHKAYEILNVLEVIKSMDYDCYVDWLEHGTEGDVKTNLECAKKVFQEHNMPQDYIDIIDIKLKDYED